MRANTDEIEQIICQQVLNPETFRKNGDCMKTPVWFVQDGETLIETPMANSLKVKHYRNNERLNLVASKVNRKGTGSWIPARALEIDDPGIQSNVSQLFNKKYGLMKKLFDNQRAKNGGENTILEIKLIRRQIL
jgi:uncharacterized protein